MMQKTKYQSLSFLQETIFLLIHYFLSFPKCFKSIIQCFLHPKVRSIFLYPSLEDEDIPFSYTFEVDQTPSSKLYDIQA